MQTEADDEDDSELNGSHRGGLTDGQTLGEIMQADASGDEERKGMGGDLTFGESGGCDS